MRRDSQYPTKRDHMICKCLTLSITYAATIGGLITITGTSTNLIFAEQFNTYVTVHTAKNKSRVSVAVRFQVYTSRRRRSTFTR